MIVFRARFRKLRSRLSDRLLSIEVGLDKIFSKDRHVNGLIAFTLIATVLGGTSLYLTQGREIADLAKTLAGHSEPQHRNQTPVATEETSTKNRTMEAEPLGWLQAGERPTAEQKLIKICAYATSIASENPAPTYPVSETRTACDGAHKALAKENTRACVSALMDVLHAVHSDKLNIVTKGAVAASCNNLPGLDKLINNGTADNPAFPLFGSDYDGMDRFDSVVFSNADS